MAERKGLLEQAFVAYTPLGTSLAASDFYHTSPCMAGQVGYISALFELFLTKDLEEKKKEKTVK